VTCRQIEITREQRMLIGERNRNFVWRKKRSIKPGKKHAKGRSISMVNGNVQYLISNS